MRDRFLVSSFVAIRIAAFGFVVVGLGSGQFPSLVPAPGGALALPPAAAARSALALGSAA